MERSSPGRRLLIAGTYVGPMVRDRSAHPVVRFGALATGLLLLLSACGSTSSADAAGRSSSSSSTSTSSSVAGSTGTYSTGSQSVSWDVDGVTRTAELVVPADLTDPAPLVVAYHG